MLEGSRIPVRIRRHRERHPLGKYANFVINFCQILLSQKYGNYSGGARMRVSDDRYTRDRQRYDLALRLIRHEARTFTIRQWTGLSDDRIRKLYRSYVLDHDERSVLRHRGKSPRQAAYFFKNPEVTFHAAQLASLFLLYGLVGNASGALESRYRVGSLDSGTLLCQAYEAYIELHEPVSISFEHAWFLLLALARRDEVGVTRCDHCGGLRLLDLLARHKQICSNCHRESVAQTPALNPLPRKCGPLLASCAPAALPPALR
jgi:hypothetical protein